MKPTKSGVDLSVQLDENFNEKVLIAEKQQRNLGRSVANFCILSSAVFGFFILNGISQEKLFRVPGFHSFGWYLTLVQAVVYIILSFTEIRMKRAQIFTPVPIKLFATVALFTVTTTGLSNASVGYMNYPTQLMFKSCKIIPVMVGRILIQGKKYGCLDFSSACSMTAGLIFFSLADVEVAPNFQLKGIVMVCLSLCADAIIGNMQEKVLKNYTISNAHMIFWSYCIGFVYMFCGLIASGELVEAYRFCSKQPLETYPLMLIFGICGYFGLNAILLLIHHFGAVLAVTVTTFRKTLTVCLSFIFFTKPFTFQYVWSGCLVLLGIYIGMYAKNHAKVDDFVRRSLKSFINKLLPVRPVINLV